MISLITTEPSDTVMLSRYRRLPSSVFSYPGLNQVTLRNSPSTRAQLSSLAIMVYLQMSIR